jgi:hypothetical protein
MTPSDHRAIQTLVWALKPLIQIRLVIFDPERRRAARRSDRKAHKLMAFSGKGSGGMPKHFRIRPFVAGQN